MKYKVGDKVKVRGDLEVGNDYDGKFWNSDMDYLKNKIITIKKVFENCYKIQEDHWYFTDAMFEEEFKIGDKVRLVRLDDETSYYKKYLNKIFIIKAIYKVPKNNKKIACLENTYIQLYLHNLEKVNDTEDGQKMDRNWTENNNLILNTTEWINFIDDKLKNNEGENNMKILEIYEERTKTNIMKEYIKNTDEIKENDIFTQFAKNTKKQFEELYKNEYNELEEKAEFSLNVNFDLYSKETNEKLEELSNTKNTKLKELKNIIEEIEALLELAPNYEEQIKILKNYDIIDKKTGKLKEI